MRAKMIYNLLKINIITIISLFLTGASTYAATRNIDTPNLSFEKGSFENWTRYYGYYGPANYAEQAHDRNNTPLVIHKTYNEDETNTTDEWTEKVGSLTTEHGYFEVVASTSYDLNLACDNL